MLHKYFVQLLAFFIASVLVISQLGLHPATTIFIATILLTTVFCFLFYRSSKELK